LTLRRRTRWEKRKKTKGDFIFNFDNFYFDNFGCLTKKRIIWNKLFAFFEKIFVSCKNGNKKFKTTYISKKKSF